MKQYDMEWKEIQFKSTKLIGDVTEPYIKKLVNAE